MRGGSDPGPTSPWSQETANFVSFLLIVLAGAIAVTVSIVLLNRRQHISEVFTTQRPGEQKIVWHTMRPVWERGIFQEGSAQSITSVTSDSSALYPIVGDTVSKITKSSGDLAWTKPLTGSGETSDGSLAWDAAVVSGPPARLPDQNRRQLDKYG